MKYPSGPFPPIAGKPTDVIPNFDTDRSVLPPAGRETGRESPFLSTSGTARPSPRNNEGLPDQPLGGLPPRGPSCKGKGVTLSLGPAAAMILFTPSFSTSSILTIACSGM